MVDFTINGRTFRSSKMELRKQFHVHRRIALIYPAFLGARAVMDNDPLLAVGYISSAVNRLNDGDWDFIMDACLDVVKVQQAENLWVDVKTKGTSLLQFQDITLTDLDLVMLYVIEENLGPFIDALPSLTSIAKALFNKSKAQSST